MDDREARASDLPAETTAPARTFSSTNAASGNLILSTWGPCSAADRPLVPRPVRRPIWPVSPNSMASMMPLLPDPLGARDRKSLLAEIDVDFSDAADLFDMGYSSLITSGRPRLEVRRPRRAHRPSASCRASRGRGAARFSAASNSIANDLLLKGRHRQFLPRFWRGRGIPSRDTQKTPILLRKKIWLALLNLWTPSTHRENYIGAEQVLGIRGLGGFVPNCRGTRAVTDGIADRTPNFRAS